MDFGRSGLDQGRSNSRRLGSRRSLAGLRLERLEDRPLLSLLANSVADLHGLGFTTVLNARTTTDVAAFRSLDPGAVASDFLASINWGDGTAPTAGTITEDASGVFHVSGTHTYTDSRGGLLTPAVTIRDINGALYQTGSFYETNLVSSVSGQAPIVDANLINPWGMFLNFGPGPSPVSDEGTGLVTSYDLPNLTAQSGTITIPSGSPTGITYNDSQGFDVAPSTPAQYLYATLGGTIAGWASGSAATTLATVPGAKFTGLDEVPFTSPGSGSTWVPSLFATDFTGTTGSHGIDVFNSSLQNLTGAGGAYAGKFADPSVPAGFEPFNIVYASVGTQGALVVAYARPSGTSRFTGTGGYIDEFDSSGNLIKTIFSDPAGTSLNGPWGMALSPWNLGSDGNDLLVGSFDGGSGGTITVIDPSTGSVVGQIGGADGDPILNQGLWSLQRSIEIEPGSSIVGFDGGNDSIYLSAGIDSQTQGLLARVSHAPAASADVVALVASPDQPGASATAGRAFFGPIASFEVTIPEPTIILVDPAVGTPPNDFSGSPSPGDFYNVTIDWGDDTPATAGTIATAASQSGDYTFDASGAHTYAAAGTYTITVNVHDVDGLAETFTNTATVAASTQTGNGGTPTVTGRLNPALDPDISGMETITNDVRPDFIGIASRPGAAISLYATAAGTITPILIGTGTVGAGGTWNIAADRALADGTYSISAEVGGSAGGPMRIMPALVIDTVGPTVPPASIAREGRSIVVTFHDPVGIDESRLDDPNNYLLVEAGRRHTHRYRIAVVSSAPGTTPGTETVRLRIRGGRGPLPLRRLELQILTAGQSHPAGIQDLAGNPLVGGSLVEGLSAIPMARAASGAKGLRAARH
jgi:uncharacterized protein (TIGR03118 family)